MKYFDYIYNPYNSEEPEETSRYYGYRQSDAQAVFQQPRSFQPPEQMPQETLIPLSDGQRPDQLADIDPYVYPQNLPGALQLILDALNTEQRDAAFYRYLVNIAPTQEDKDIIINIQKDELKHYQLLRRIYTNLTGLVPPEQQPSAAAMPQIRTYCQGLFTAFKWEISDSQRYRKILYAMQDRVNINILTDIIADEIEHGSLYSFLYAKNSCGRQSPVQY